MADLVEVDEGMREVIRDDGCCVGFAILRDGGWHAHGIGGERIRAAAFPSAQAVAAWLGTHGHAPGEPPKHPRDEPGVVEKFYFEDGEHGERQIHESQDEAMAVAVSTLVYYRKNSQREGEWSRAVEDVVVGRVRLTGADEDEHEYTPTHRATAFGNRRAGYDYEMRPLAVPVAA